MSMTPERIEEKKQIAVTVSRMPEEKINDLYDKICELAHAEDGEQLEGILSEFNLMNVGYDAAWDEVERLLAALEESQQQVKTLKTEKALLEGELGQAEAYKHFEAERTKEAQSINRQLVEAQQTIAQQQVALEFYALEDNNNWWIGGLDEVIPSEVMKDGGAKARATLGNKEGEK